MKAILHTQFGSPDRLEFKEVKTPEPKDNEVLIKVKASSVTSTDCNARNLTFTPKIFRFPARLFVFGVFRPRVNILGFDVAGEVESVGQDVTKFKQGDAVFGTAGIKFGGHAQYVCMAEDAVLTTKPDNISWVEAGATFLGASTALYFIRDVAQLKAGQSILIYGASGGVGSFAIQLAKFFDAQVTAVCSGVNAQMVTQLGADKVLDYTKGEFSSHQQSYDFVFDVVGKTSFLETKHLLKPEGTFIASVVGLRELIQMLWASFKGGKKIKGGVAPEKLDDLVFIKTLLESGKLKTQIDKVYPLEQTADAYKYVEKGHKKGNVAIEV